jgi:hypothetical protein
MSVATEKKMRELRIVWASLEDGFPRMAWVDEFLLVGRTRMEGGYDGR